MTSVCLLDVDPTNDPRAELARIMSTISEGEFLASWHMGIEEWCWKRMHSPSSDDACSKRMRQLSEKIGGWVRWDDDLGAVVFVPMAEWLKEVERHGA